MLNKKKIVLLISVAVVLVIIFSLLFSMNSREKTYPYHEQLRDMVAFRIKFFDISEQCDKDFKKKKVFACFIISDFSKNCIFMLLLKPIMI